MAISVSMFTNAKELREFLAGAGLRPQLELANRIPTRSADEAVHDALQGGPASGWPGERSAALYSYRGLLHESQLNQTVNSHTSPLSSSPLEKFTGPREQ